MSRAKPPSLQVVPSRSTARARRRKVPRRLSAVTRSAKETRVPLATHSGRDDEWRSRRTARDRPRPTRHLDQRRARSRDNVAGCRVAARRRVARSSGLKNSGFRSSNDRKGQVGRHGLGPAEIRPERAPGQFYAGTRSVAKGGPPHPSIREWSPASPSFETTVRYKRSALRAVHPHFEMSSSRVVVLTRGSRIRPDPPGGKRRVTSR